MNRPHDIIFGDSIIPYDAGTVSIDPTTVIVNEDENMAQFMGGTRVPTLANQHMQVDSNTNVYYQETVEEGLMTDKERIQACEFMTRDADYAGPTVSKVLYGRTLRTLRSTIMKTTEYERELRNTRDIMFEHLESPRGDDLKVFLRHLSPLLIDYMYRPGQLTISGSDNDMKHAMGIITLICSYLGHLNRDSLFALPRTPAHGGKLTQSINDGRLGPLESRQVCSTCRQPKESCPSHFAGVAVGELTNPLLFDEIARFFKVVCQHCSKLCMDTAAYSIVPDKTSRLFNHVPLPWSPDIVQYLQNLRSKKDQLDVQLGGELMVGLPIFLGPKHPLPTEDEMESAAREFSLPPSMGPPLPIPVLGWVNVVDEVAALRDEELEAFNSSPDQWKQDVDYWRQRYLAQYAEWCLKMDRAGNVWDLYWARRVKYWELKSALVRNHQCILEAINAKTAPKISKSVDKPTAENIQLRNKQVYLYLLRDRIDQLKGMIHTMNQQNVLTVGGVLKLHAEMILRENSYKTSLTINRLC